MNKNISNQKENLVINKQKSYGQVFTPTSIVCLILDEINYIDESIIDKKILEPSFGEGVFLIEIVKRIINIGHSLKLSNESIKTIIENCVYGIEIDYNLYIKAIESLNILVKSYGIENINWNLYNTNALDCDFLYGKFDYVVGNPPYVRIHNMDEYTKRLIKKYNFSKGNSDLYVIFFELGIKFLNDKGILGYITPNSYMKNTSQKSFRKYLLSNNLIKKIIDFKSSNIFEVSTYTSISILDNSNNSNKLIYSEYNNLNEIYSISVDINDFKINNSISDRPWNFSNIENYNLLKYINQREFKLSQICNIQYGISTNRDYIYICQVPQKINSKYTLFNNYKIENEILRPIVKCSTFKGEEILSKVIFPYNFNTTKKLYEPISESELKSKYPLAYEYLSKHKDELLKRDLDKNASTWYQFARSQGLNCAHQKKIILNHILDKDKSTVDSYILDKDVIVYSGIYITTSDNTSLSKIKDLLGSEEFCTYCKLVGKDMSGGFKSISSKNIKDYGLNTLNL